MLIALEKAAALVPPHVDTRLRELDLDVNLGKLALCALAYPVDVVTPDISASDVIAVYLRHNGRARETFSSLLRQPPRLIVEMSLLAEMRDKITKLRKIWPSSLQQARDRLKELDFYSNGLGGLWDALELNAGNNWDNPAQIAKIVEKSGDSPTLWLMLAESLLRAGLPQQALEAASRAARDAEKIILPDAKNAAMRDFIHARALYARGVAHWRLDQLALAETDLDACMDMLENVKHPYDALPRALLARGALRWLRQDVEGMCADYISACGEGQCQGLAVARRQGLCSAEK